MKNTIIANNTATGGTANLANFYRSGGSLVSNGYNLFGIYSTTYFNPSTANDWKDQDGDGTYTLQTVGTTGTLSIDSTAATNSSLNGTYTHALQINSLGINHGSSLAHGSVSIPSTDQRGLSPSGTPDIGAYEYGGSNDSTAPTITNVSSDKANGSYTTGEVVDIDVTFSEAVTSTGNVTVTLETGATDRTCAFTVTSATTGTCNYTVQAGDTSSDLEVSTISGTIADASSNAMSNFVPATNLAANKALVIDTTVVESVGSVESGGGSDHGRDPDTSAAAVAGKSITVNMPKILSTDAFLKVTVIVPEPKLVTKVIFRAFGKTYVLKKKTASAYVFTGKAPSAVGSYTYTATVFYGGSTSLSKKGTVRVALKPVATSVDIISVYTQKSRTIVKKFDHAMELYEPQIEYPGLEPSSEVEPIATSEASPVIASFLPTIPPISSIKPTPTPLAYFTNFFSKLSSASSTVRLPFMNTEAEYDVLKDDRIPQNLKTHAYKSVSIKITDDTGKPLEGATVTIASDPKTDSTNSEGVVTFKDIHIGQHTLTIAYNNSSAEQGLFLNQPTQTAQVLVATKLIQGYTQWQVTKVAIASVIGTLIFIYVIYLKSRRKNRKQ